MGAAARTVLRSNTLPLHQASDRLTAITNDTTMRLAAIIKVVEEVCDPGSHADRDAGGSQVLIPFAGLYVASSFCGSRKWNPAFARVTRQLTLQKVKELTHWWIPRQYASAGHYPA